jgi:small subunit ribosomal protein S17
MSEDEKKDMTEETPQDEAQSPAGPVEGEDSSSSRDDAAGEESTPTPPAGDADASDDAPAAEADSSSADEQAAESESEPEAAAEEPAAEVETPAEKPAPAEEAEPNPEDELPWKERRRLAKSRKPHKAGPQLSVEERIKQREGDRRRRAELRRKQRAEARTEKSAGTGTPPAEKDANAAKVRQGIVISDKGQKSITVRIDIVRRHPTYEKVIRRSRTLHAHDESNEAGEGDIVRVVETRPLSKTKRWRLVEVLEKAK